MGLLGLGGPKFFAAVGVPGYDPYGTPPGPQVSVSGYVANADGSYGSNLTVTVPFSYSDNELTLTAKILAAAITASGHLDLTVVLVP